MRKAVGAAGRLDAVDLAAAILKSPGALCALLERFRLSP